MSRGQTIAELRWLDTPDFMAVARAWQADASTILLQFVWRGYDLLCGEVLSRIEVNDAEEDLERGITQLLEPRIRRAMTGDEPFDIQHGSYEEESRQPPPAQPPQYDLAYVWNQNERLKWPLEAKVLLKDTLVREYVKAMNERFLTCMYAPFSSEGAMLAYLFSGSPQKVFSNVSKALLCCLAQHPGFPGRPHKTSDHVRTVPHAKKYAAAFRCHHMVLQISALAEPNSQLM